MVEIDFTNEDYDMLEKWFERLFGKKHDESKHERFLYSKILVFHDAQVREDNKMKDLMEK